MKALMACEESQAICIEARKLGHDAYSCDILPCSGGHPEWHLQCDVRDVLYDSSWDVVLAFPPCTDLAVSGARWFKQKWADGRQQQSIKFFMLFPYLKCKWSIEQPIGIMSTFYRKPDQIIQPWMFGHMETKATCLWLHGLPLLVETNNVKAEMMRLPVNQRNRIHHMAPSPERSRERSKTYSGIAKAMAEQWLGN